MSLYAADCLAGRSTGAAPSQKSHAGHNVLDCGVELSGDGLFIADLQHCNNEVVVRMQQ